MSKRRVARQIKVAGVKIGGSAPVSIQSMTKVAASDVTGSVRQIKQLKSAGCELVRLAVKNIEDARAIKKIKAGSVLPIVCDIHFDYRLAIECVKNGADKIRLNPGNIGKREEIAAVVSACRRARIPVRIGVNSGSVALRRQRADRTDGAGALVSAALNYVKIFEELDFRDIIISLKASDVGAAVDSYRRISDKCDYPLHLGVTASGSLDNGIVKSSMGIGALLLDGIGDTVRVSLTADPVEEVRAARRILSAAGARSFGPEVLSCPTCGRCQVDLLKIVRQVEDALYAKRYTISADRPFKIAIMGCEVNGPGEAKDADIGIAFGRGFGVIFRNGKIVRKITVKNAAKELIACIRSVR